MTNAAKKALASDMLNQVFNDLNIHDVSVKDIEDLKVTLYSIISEYTDDEDYGDFVG